MWWMLNETVDDLRLASNSLQFTDQNVWNLQSEGENLLPAFVSNIIYRDLIFLLPFSCFSFNDRKE